MASTSMLAAGVGKGGVSEGSENVRWTGIGSGHMAGEEEFPAWCAGTGVVQVGGWVAAHWDPGWLGEDWPGMEDSTCGAGAKFLLRPSPAMNVAAVSLTSRSSRCSPAE